MLICGIVQSVFERHGIGTVFALSVKERKNDEIN